MTLLRLGLLADIVAAAATAAALAAAVPGRCCNRPRPGLPYPIRFSPEQVLSAKVQKCGEGGVTHQLKLQLSHGSMPDSIYEVSGGVGCWIADGRCWPNWQQLSEEKSRCCLL